MTITAIILNYKNYEDVRACILSLQTQVLPSDSRLQILVIDNASGDDNTKRLQAEFPQHRYIYNEQNLGFAKGVNQGIRESAGSDYFLLVNNDAALGENCLSGLISASAGKALAGPAIYYKGEPEIIWQGGGYFSKLKMNITVPFKNQKGTDSEPLTVDFLSGCILLIPSSAIAALRGFDEDFFFYGEDLDFCLRGQKAGIKSVYCPRLTATHNIKRAAVSRTNAFVLKNLAFSYLLIIRKHFPRLLPYGIALFIFLYTPFRLYQIVSGGNDWRNIGAWLAGGLLALKKKL